MESTYSEICSVSLHFDDAIGLYGGHMFRLVALPVSCVALCKLPSVVCQLVLADMRWLSLCCFSKAHIIPDVAFTGNSCEKYIRLLDDLLLMMSSASSLCVSIISDVFFGMRFCLLKLGGNHAYRLPCR